MLPFAGEIVIESRLAALTVTAAVAVIPSKVAPTVELPTFVPVAKPLFVIESAEVEDDHCVTFVTSCEVPSEKSALAVNCWVFPSVRAIEEGVTCIEAADAELTVSVAVPLIGAMLAVMVV